MAKTPEQPGDGDDDWTPPRVILGADDIAALDDDALTALRKRLATGGDDDARNIRTSFFRMLDKMSAEDLKASNSELGIKWLELKARASLRHLRGLASEYKKDPPKW